MGQPKAHLHDKKGKAQPTMKGKALLKYRWRKAGWAAGLVGIKGWDVGGGCPSLSGLSKGILGSSPALDQRLSEDKKVPSLAQSSLENEKAPEGMLGSLPASTQVPEIAQSLPEFEKASSLAQSSSEFRKAPKGILGSLSATTKVPETLSPAATALFSPALAQTMPKLAHSSSLFAKSPPIVELSPVLQLGGIGMGQVVPGKAGGMFR